LRFWIQVLDLGFGFRFWVYVLGLGFGFRFGLGSCNKDLMLIQVYRPCHLTNPSNRNVLTAKWLQECFSLWSLIDTSLLHIGNAKRLCLFCLIMQKHCCIYFAFNQSYLP